VSLILDYITIACGLVGGAFLFLSSIQKRTEAILLVICLATFVLPIVVAGPWTTLFCFLFYVVVSTLQPLGACDDADAHYWITRGAWQVTLLVAWGIVAVTLPAEQQNYVLPAIGILLSVSRGIPFSKKTSWWRQEFRSFWIVDVLYGAMLIQLLISFNLQDSWIWIALMPIILLSVVRTVFSTGGFEVAFNFQQILCQLGVFVLIAGHGGIGMAHAIQGTLLVLPLLWSGVLATEQARLRWVPLVAALPIPCSTMGEELQKWFETNQMVFNLQWAVIIAVFGSIIISFVRVLTERDRDSGWLIQNHPKYGSTWNYVFVGGYIASFWVSGLVHHFGRWAL